MKLQFDANQDFQLDALNAAVDLFKGQPVESNLEHGLKQLLLLVPEFGE